MLSFKLLQHHAWDDEVRELNFFWELFFLSWNLSAVWLLSLCLFLSAQFPHKGVLKVRLLSSIRKPSCNVSNDAGYLVPKFFQLLLRFLLCLTRTIFWRFFQFLIFNFICFELSYEHSEYSYIGLGDFLCLLQKSLKICSRSVLIFLQFDLRFLVKFCLFSILNGRQTPLLNSKNAKVTKNVINF